MVNPNSSLAIFISIWPGPGKTIILSKICLNSHSKALFLWVSLWIFKNSSYSSFDNPLVKPLPYSHYNLDDGLVYQRHIYIHMERYHYAENSIFYHGHHHEDVFDFCMCSITERTLSMELGLT